MFDISGWGSTRPGSAIAIPGRGEVRAERAEATQLQQRWRGLNLNEHSNQVRIINMQSHRRHTFGHFAGVWEQLGSGCGDDRTSRRGSQNHRSILP